MAATEVTDATFQTEVIDKSQEVVVVVDLWAPWCGPCKTLGPIIEKVIDATDGKVVLAKVNKHFGALHVLQDIDLTVHRGEVVVVDEEYGVRLTEIVGSPDA